ncbi:ABC-type transport system, involved in lipoprotein release, permease component [Ferrimonas sediminum]|uniref:ABC-type transport system, involved in lipoprotein release, permease component n=1 Tax=Ferrimonas sediminum TaxID=718193 RepID=A0A1G8VPJ9_9GAMM|nr:FtsX-like permease family protein [Ferrimonas sediminum]SDJ68018.1 ABC-type transport system, involved in lipoprotein release, permease component [Ferrimonas sediminum]
MLVTLAWRNLWRQKRRTLLTAAALALALLLSLATRSLQEGTYANNIDNAARFSTGLVQLQHPDFKESRSIDDLLPGTAAFIGPARAIDGISHILPRLESFALAAGASRSKGVMVMGVQPLAEARYANVDRRLTLGHYLSEDDQGVLIGEGLARYLSLSVGDELVLYGQGYHGQTAAGLFPIRGVLSFPMAGVDNQLVYMPLPLAQQLYGCEGLVSNWVLHTHTLAQLPTATQALRHRYPDAAVWDWQALSPEMAQQIQMDRAGGLFMMYLLYGVVGFGLFATLVMMILERQREFGVMLATGMVRRQLLLLIIIESGLLALVGVVLGLAIAAPLLAWFAYHPLTLTGEAARMVMEMGWDPLMPVLLSPQLVINQILIVLGLLGLCLAYPLWRLYRLNLVQALKGGGDDH